MFLLFWWWWSRESLNPFIEQYGEFVGFASWVEPNILLSYNMGKTKEKNMVEGEKETNIISYKYRASYQ